MIVAVSAGMSEGSATTRLARSVAEQAAALLRQSMPATSEAGYGAGEAHPDVRYAAGQVALGTRGVTHAVREAGAASSDAGQVGAGRAPANSGANTASTGTGPVSTRADFASAGADMGAGGPGSTVGTTDAGGVEVIELRPYARDIAEAMVAGFPSERLEQVFEKVRRADALVAATPIYNALPSGLFIEFFDVLDEGVLEGKPVAIGATGGSPRHSLVTEQAIRPMFVYLHALVPTTAVYAATEDWGAPGVGFDGAEGSSLLARIAREAGELAALVAGSSGQVGAATRGGAGRVASAASAGAGHAAAGEALGSLARDDGRAGEAGGGLAVAPGGALQAGEPGAGPAGDADGAGEADGWVGEADGGTRQAGGSAAESASGSAREAGNRGGVRPGVLGRVQGEPGDVAGTAVDSGTGEQDDDLEFIPFERLLARG